MATIKAKRPIKLQGLALSKGQVLEDLPVTYCLSRWGDPNLVISFSELDRKELKQLEPSLFKRLSKVLNSTITTHDELCALLLPSKPKVRKPALKSKKSSLTE